MCNGFNSNMVRLKAGCLVLAYVARLPFQFQHGTIKSGNRIGRKLKRGVFQFQHGTIKRGRPAALHQERSGFNSNMVRLKGNKLHALQVNDFRFQFQHGTIKSTVF